MRNSDSAMPRGSALPPDSEIRKGIAVSPGVHLIPALLIVSCLVLLILCILVMAAVPPVSRDALTHHLAVPKLWIAHGGMIEMPELVFSYYPMNLNLLYVIPLLFGNDILPKYIHFLFALGTAWLIYAFLIQHTTRTFSLMGALLFLSTPVIVKLSINVYVDLGLIFFTWAAIISLCRWAHRPQSLKHLIYAAIFCGLGMGTKYNGLIVLFLLTLFIAPLYIRSAMQPEAKVVRTIGYPLLFFAVAITCFSPWMVKNYRLTGNPIYPLYNRQINVHADRSAPANMSMRPWLQRKLIYEESALETALIPLRIFFQGKDDDPRLFDGKLNPILLIGPLLFMIGWKRAPVVLRRERLLLASFAILYLMYASFMVDMRMRYIAPIIPPLVVLTVLGIYQVMQQINRIRLSGTRIACQWLFVTGLCFCLYLNAAYVKTVFHSVNPMAYISGEVPREAYLRAKLPEYGAVQFVNKIEHRTMKILALFMGNRLYYFDRPVQFGVSDFARMTTAASDGSHLARMLEARGFTHCMIGVQHFEAWAVRQFDEPHKAIIAQWLRNHCRQLYSENGYVVFALRGNDERQASF